VVVKRAQCSRPRLADCILFSLHVRDIHAALLSHAPSRAHDTGERLLKASCKVLNSLLQEGFGMLGDEIRLHDWHHVYRVAQIAKAGPLACVG